MWAVSYTHLDVYKRQEVEDSAFGFVKFENGATVFLESAWALNTTNQKQAMTTVYGTKAGAEMDYPFSGTGTDLSLIHI